MLWCLRKASRVPSYRRHVQKAVDTSTNQGRCLAFACTRRAGTKRRQTGQSSGQSPTLAIWTLSWWRLAPMLPSGPFRRYPEATSTPVWAPPLDPRLRHPQWWRRRWPDVLAVIGPFIPMPRGCIHPAILGPDTSPSGLASPAISWFPVLANTSLFSWKTSQVWPLSADTTACRSSTPWLSRLASHTWRHPLQR